MTARARTDAVTAPVEMPRKTASTVTLGAPASRWYQDAVIYELHVRAYQDSNADGVGDLAGLVRRLDHIRDLGATAVWLLPFYPSPLRDDGYDIADYKEIHPAYGSMRDFRTFLREAHRRDLRVITEVVMNHTSEQHPWFQRARAAKPGSWQRNFYVWADTPEGYPDARDHLQDFESSNWAWDAVAGQYYWHRFYSHQPDLNFDEARVREAMFDVVDFWLSLGVDGLRLDAVPYLFEREGTNCENLPETHGFLSDLRRHIDAKFRGPDAPGRGEPMAGGCGRVLRQRRSMPHGVPLPVDAADVHGDPHGGPVPAHRHLEPDAADPRELPMGHVPAEPRRVDARDGDGRGARLHVPRLRGRSAGADQSRDPPATGSAARQRPAPDRADERAAVFAPGHPGHLLRRRDRDGGQHLPGRSQRRADADAVEPGPQRRLLGRQSPAPVPAADHDPEYHLAAINVEAQQNNPSSLLWWMRRSDRCCPAFTLLSRGDIEFLYPENRKVWPSFARSSDDRTWWSRTSRGARSSSSWICPVSMARSPSSSSARPSSPRIGQFPYFITLGPYGYFWFRLQPDEREEEIATSPVPTLTSAGSWDAVLAEPTRGALERSLPRFLVRQRWFGAKGRKISTVSIADTIRIPGAERDGFKGLVTLVDVTLPLQPRPARGRARDEPALPRAGRRADPVLPLARGFLAGNRAKEGGGETERSKNDALVKAGTYRDCDWEVVDRLKKVAAGKNASPAQAALAWLLSRPTWARRSSAPPASTSSPRPPRATEFSVTAEEAMLLEEPYQFRVSPEN